MEEIKGKTEIGYEENGGTVPGWTSEETMLKQYQILQQERDKYLPKEIEDVSGKGQPVTCFLYPTLTPNKLLEHLTEQNASDACILEWMRHLQTLRQHNPKLCSCAKKFDLDKSYGVKLLGK